MTKPRTDEPLLNLQNRYQEKSTFMSRLGVFAVGMAIGFMILGVMFMMRKRAAQQQAGQLQQQQQQPAPSR